MPLLSVGQVFTAALANAIQGTLTSQHANYNATDGDLVKMTGQHTVTLPVPNAQVRVGVMSVDGTGAAPCTITSAINGGDIIGLGVAASATSILLGTPGAMVLLQADGTNWYVVDGQQDTGWLPIPTYTNSWVAAGGPAAGSVTGYRLMGNTVRLSGTIQSGTSGTAAFTLPAGARPKTQLTLPGIMASDGSTTFGMVISTAGVATPRFGSQTLPEISPMSFTID